MTSVEPLPHAPTPFGQLVAGEVRAQLARRNLTGRAFAKLIDKEQSWVSRRLQGLTAITMDDLDLIARALDMTAVELLAGMPPHPGALLNTRRKTVR
jgi:transcriptional regulator with XRE-family HTH domain